ncbi:calsyntenin-1-like [Eriocheir sinensis]|uniref:calsyntenin-1-like n=1 Tax=Eriocheir sinensis TaxID=95602 RepID=UPI0021C83312|nr:calsyntenin-1-like [Eriocheir sinensis]
MSAWILLIFAIGAITAKAEHAGVIPQFDLVRPSEGYHGLVSEDSTLVEVQPAIRAYPDVCTFRIANKHHGEAPFMIHLRDGVSGEAELQAKRPLNCEKRKNYKFDITAISCSGVESHNVTVHVKVTDVNEYAPVFVEPSYVRDVDEGRLYEEVVALQADDQDCSPKYGDICRYELLTRDQPFTIDSEGVIRNTEPLDYERSHNHILSAVAYDCGMKRSQPVMVTIKVNRVCRIGWKGIPDQVEYSPGSGRQELFPAASLELCNVPCRVERVQARVTLTTTHIGKGCDRDTYSVAAQRKMCGASSASVELLPAPGAGREWTAGLHSDEGHEGDLIYQFEGDSSGAVVPESVLPHNLTNTFTISTWLKHKAHPNMDKHTKEHVLCTADDHKMNRHHTAVFVRNCRLILLLRRESSEANLNTFQPAEWRWKLSQVCDNEWHHYSIHVSFPEVTLYVDGHIFRPENGESPEVIDDWPLHPTRGINTTMSVGACWQGSESSMKHGLTGYLAGLSVLVGALESPRVLACLTRCQEALDTPAMELLQPSMELLTNNEMTQITVEGNNITNMETLIHRIAYVNSRDFPTPGRRPITVVANIMCDSGKSFKVDPAQSFVVVMQPHQPSIELNGTTNFAEEYESFRQGLRVFPDVGVYLSPAAEEATAPTPGGQLDECVVSVYPSLNPDHETLLLPDNLISELGLASTTTRQGATISGAHTTHHYQSILRQIHYANRKPAYYLNRAFKLSCSELGGRFTSNEYVQTVTVIHPQLSVEKTSDLMDPNSSPVDQASLSDTPALPPRPPHGQRTPVGGPIPHHNPPPAPAHARVSTHHVEAKAPHTVKDVYFSSSVMEGAAVNSAGHAVTIIIVVCVGFLVFMVVLGVIRVRAAHTRGTHQDMADTEMAWDDTSLNITVNPMEQQLGMPETQRLRDDEDDDDDSSDDGSNFNDDLDSSDEEEGKPKELEWDDSTLKM